MADNKKGFILYADQQELFEQLDNEQAGKLIKHIISYVNDENPVSKDPFINLAFTPIKQQLKRDLEKWESTRKKRSDAGKASAEAKRLRAEQDATKSTSVESVEQNSTKSTVNDNVNVNVNDNVSVKDNDINNTTGGSVPVLNLEDVPPIELFIAYANEQARKVDLVLDLVKVKLKYNSWVANGWKTGGDRPHKIRNWKNTVNNTLPYLKAEVKKVYKNPPF